MTDFSTVLHRCGIALADYQGQPGTGIVVRSPIDGAELACLAEQPATAVQTVIDRASAAFAAWRLAPGAGARAR